MVDVEATKNPEAIKKEIVDYTLRLRHGDHLVDAG